MLKPSFVFSVAQPQPHTWSIGGKKGILVTVDLDTGETTFGEHYTPDEAARVFWEAVAGVVRWTKATEGEPVSSAGRGRSRFFAVAAITFVRLSAYFDRAELLRSSDSMPRWRLRHSVTCQPRAELQEWPITLRSKHRSARLSIGRRDPESFFREARSRENCAALPGNRFEIARGSIMPLPQ